jgi:hypothetical protein
MTPYGGASEKQVAKDYMHTAHRDLGALPSLASLYTPATNLVQVTRATAHDWM